MTMNGDRLEADVVERSFPADGRALAEIINLKTSSDDGFWDWAFSKK